MTAIQVLSPCETAPVPQPLTLAPRGELPARARLTLICNGKAKAREVLEMLTDELRGALSIGAVELHSKPSAGIPLPADVAAELAQRSDLVVTALGDCGACSAASLHDALQFERHGVPATVVITDIFQRSVAAHARELGAEGYHTVVLPHPMSTRADERIRRCVRDAAAAAVEQLTAPARSAQAVA